MEYITSYLNNAANDDDARIGAEMAHNKGIQITMPRWGVSRSDYYYDKDENIIAKGLSSIKYMGKNEAENLYRLSQRKSYDYFVDLLIDLEKETRVDSRQLSNLIKLDFFVNFGNQRELFAISDIFSGLFKSGQVKKISREKIEGTPTGAIVAKYATATTKTGAEAKRYTITDPLAALREIEQDIKSRGLKDLSLLIKVNNCNDLLGYAGYVSGRDQDRPVLFVEDIYPLKRRSDGKQFAWSVSTRSVGSGRESKWTLPLYLQKAKPIEKGSLIYCEGYTIDDRGYFHLQKYHYVM